jgi:hypothetical protein
MIYFSYIHSIITYGIILWGDLPYAIKLFRIKKKGKNNYGSEEKDLHRDS